MPKLIFFGDTNPLTAREPFFLFRDQNGDWVLCDYSECGWDTAMKFAKQHEEFDITTLDVVLRYVFALYGDLEVEARNNGIALFFRRNNIKTAKDIANYFRKLLNCTYP